MAQYSVNTPITLQGLSTTMETAKKGLNKITLKNAKSVKDYLPMLYKSQAFPQLTIKNKVYSGLTMASTWDGKSIIEPEGLEFLYDVTAQHYFFGKSTAYGYDAFLFDEYKLLQKLSKELGLSVAVKKQLLGASLFNNGFLTACPDGQPFFSTTHPNDARIGGTQSNLISGGLSVSTLVDAINLLINMRDPLGRPLNYLPKRLFVHTTKAIYAKQMVAGAGGFEYGNADHNKNPEEFEKIEVMPYPWFSTTTQWMLQAQDFETYISEKVGLKTTMEEQDDHSIKHDAIFVNSMWAESWMGYVGSTGV